jgi:hypothetical protein
MEGTINNLAKTDRINIFRQENIRKQSEAIQHLHENEKSQLLWKEAVLNSENNR